MIYRITYRNNLHKLRIIDVCEIDDVVVVCSEIAETKGQLISVVLHERRYYED